MKKRILSFIFVALLLITIFPFSIFAQDSITSSEPEAIEDLSQTSIVYDFENVFYGAFNVADYRPNSTKSQRQVVAFTEQRNSKGEIELYFYLYNPQQIPIYTTGQNKITVSYSLGTVKFEEYQKYDIEQIDAMYFSKNLSSQTNASLIKYKVSGFSLSTEESLRAYSLGELELRLLNGVISLPVGKTYTFNENVDGTLDVITGGKSIIEIDEIGHTYYRVQSDTVGKFNDIRTVYFAVKKDIINQYGLMDSVNVVWEEKALQPMLLLDDLNVLADFQEILGKTDLTGFNYSFGAGMQPGQFTGTSLNIGHIGTKFKYGFNSLDLPNRFYAGTDFYYNGYLDNLVWSEHYHNLHKKNSCLSTLDKLYFAFYCNYDNVPRVSGEQLLESVDKFDGKLDGLYANELFTSSQAYNVTYNVRDEVTLNQYSVDTDVWKYITNGWKFTTEEAGNVEIIRFEKFNPYSYERALKKGVDYLHNYLSESYQIDSNDVKDFCDFFEKNSKDSNIYFIRYSVTDSYIEEASVFGDSYLSFDTGLKFLDSILNGVVPLDECYACNGSLVHTTMVNDFDIITLGFNDLRGGYSVVPVSMEPTDVIPDVNQDLNRTIAPEREKTFIEKLIEFLKKMAFIIIAIISVIIITIIILIVLLIVRIVKRKRGKKSEKKNN